MILTYEAVVLLAGFAAAAAVAAAAVHEGAGTAADAARALADARSASLAAGRLAAVDVQYGTDGRAYVTVAAAPGSAGPAVLAGAWDADGRPVRCEAAGRGDPDAGIAGIPVSAPVTLVCDAPGAGGGGGFAVASRGGHVLRVAAAAPPPVTGDGP